MSPTATEIVRRLREGDWRATMFLDFADGARNTYRSLIDTRVYAVRRIPKRGTPTTRFHFDNGTDRDEGLFDSLDDLAAVIAAHDEARTAEREWEAAAPTERSRS